MKKKIFIVAAVFISSHVIGQDDSLSRILDEVIFISHKYPKRQSETGKVVMVINRAELEHSSGRTLGELLNTVAGTTIIGANNNLGTNQNVSIRGSSGGNVLILIDGIPINDPSVNTNYYDLNFFSIEQIERIEILKGGQSTLYGSDAVAGVINIITRKKSDNKISSGAIITAGSYGTIKGSIGFNGTVKNTSYSIQYTHLKSNGFSSSHDSTDKNDFDKDDYRQDAINGNISVKLSKLLYGKLFGQFNKYKSALDAAAFTDDTDYRVDNKNIQAGAGLTYTLKKGSVNLNYHYNYVRRSYLDDSSFRNNPFFYYFKGDYIGRTHFAELFSTVKSNNWEFLVGIDLRYNNTDQKNLSVSVFPPFAPSVFESNLSDSLARMTQISPYASVVYKKKNGFNIEAGGRWNNHSVYGNNFTFTLNPSFLIHKKLKLFLNLYSAFKAPTLFQLFDPFIGNTSLKPENSIITESGADLFIKKSGWIRVTGFYRNTRNAIQFIITNPIFFFGQYKNVSRQQNYGIEIEGSYSINKLSLKANYTFTKGKITSTYSESGDSLGKSNSYNNIYRIPKHAFNLNAGIQATKKLYLSSQLHVVSKRLEPIYASSPKELEGYYTIDLYSEYRFHKKFKVFFDVKNITDKEYFDILGYNSRRINFNGGVAVEL